MGNAEVGCQDEFARGMEELDKVCIDFEDLSIKVKHNLTEKELEMWCEEKGYSIYQIAEQELILQKPYAYFHIAVRNLYGGAMYVIETTDDLAEAVQDKMSLGLSCENPAVYPLWREFRNNNNTKNSICTKMMPEIVTQLLKKVYHINNRDVLLAFECKLASFGTKSFGVKGLDFSKGEESYETTCHICYAPGELEAITDVSAEMLKNINSVDDVKAMDMSRFKEMLLEKSANIAPTNDIALFGRKLNGSGLKEYESAFYLSMPVRVG